jgi:predicted RecA/RadA family phage recombinase
MINFVRKGAQLTITATAVVEAGEVVIVNSLYGIASVSGELGSEVTISTEGVYELDKDTQEVLQGQKAYYRADTKQVTKDDKHAVVGDHDDDDATPDTSIDVDHFHIGIFVLDALASDDKAQVKID